MLNTKPFVKHFFYTTHTTNLLDKIIYLSFYLKNFKKNKRFAKANKHLALPPSYYLYETYNLDYEKYILDGEETAKEVVDNVKHYLPNVTKILEWGCGVSRVVRHIHKYIDTGATICACDINTDMINWGKSHISNIEFDYINKPFTLNYQDNTFEFIYALSVLTHIEKEEQQGWLQEVHRIMKPGGIFLFTTHGKLFFDKLLSFEEKILCETGAYTKSSNKKGHRLTTTYNEAKVLERSISKLFELLEFYDGAENMSKAGGQDLWIVRKP